jgi:hypothetical protein
MNKIKRHIIFPRTKRSGNINIDELYEGEIALKIKEGEEKIAVKTSDNKIVTFSDDLYNEGKFVSLSGNNEISGNISVNSISAETINAGIISAKNISGLTDISSVFISSAAPTNFDSSLWVNPQTLVTDSSNDFSAITSELSEIRTLVDKHEFAFNYGIVTGGLDNSTKLDMIKAATPIAPSILSSTTTSSSTNILSSDPNNLIYPQYSDYNFPNAKHISIKSAKFDTVNANKTDLIQGELIWCYDINKLYILSKNNELKLVGGNSGSSGGLDLDEIDKLSTIGFVSPNGKTFRVKVSDLGELIIYNKENDTPKEMPTPAGITVDGWNYATALFLPKLYINELYCGGLTATEHDYNYCSHNFVELSNLTSSDITLSGLSLQYGTNGTDWQVLPLWGTIKAGSTFLIRGAQCSVIDTNTTRIKVKSYDMEWYDSTGNLIRFNNTKAKFLLTCGNNICPTATPYNKVTNDGNSTSILLLNGYIDMVGLNKENPSDVDKIDNSEEAPYQYLNSNRIFSKYYNMDPVSQATKVYGMRNNSKDWYFIELDKDTIPNVSSYTPCSSSENKNIFFNKSKLKETEPNMISVTFGIQATSPNATRCFNWISTDYYDEGIMYKPHSGTDSEWIYVESFKTESGIRKYYNRIRSEATDGTPFTVHKVIIKNLSAGTYDFYVNRPNSSYKSEEREFTVKDNSEINSSFTFVQVSDQQGFNRDEYQVWKISADYIKQNIPQALFTINTGDMTQNGNRINEWIDYFDGRDSLNSLEEMTTVGNNDLCPINMYKLGTGEDNSKINPKNMSYFYTYEIDEANPPVFTVEGKETFIDSLYSFNYGNTHFMCINSELTQNTEIGVYGLSKGTQLYDYISGWCETDLSRNTSQLWNVAYCHEMPFTMITQEAKNAYYYNGIEYSSGKERSGSHMNTINTSDNMHYWFSRFCQTHNIRLVLGGHKHTYCVTYPLKETIVNNEIISMKPTIQVTLDDLQNMFTTACTGLYTETSGVTSGYSYPSTWKENPSVEELKHFCTFELVDKINAPVYAMCQATGYKHTSNKELPAPNIPWLKEYFPATVTIKSQNSVIATVNKNQRYPFYITWNVTPTEIIGKVSKIANVFDSGGLFNVNMPQSNIPSAIGGNGTENSGNNIIEIKI